MKFNYSVVRGSIILLIAVNLFSAAGFIFQLSMARLLSIEEYGILATLFSILYICGLFTESIQTLIAKYSSSEKDIGKTKNILKRALKRSFMVALISFIAYLVVAFPLSYLLEISYGLIAVSGLFIFASFLIPTTRGILQGRKLFAVLGFNIIIEGVFKLGLGILFVAIGWKVYGALAAAITATTVSLMFSFVPLRTILKTKEKTADSKNIHAYSRPTFVIILTVMIFYSIDTIIAKIVFSPEIAGMYAVASVISKAIFWGTQPISKAMFPFSAEKKVKSPKNIFLSAFALLSLAIIVALSLFYFFPVFLVDIFSGKYLPGSIQILFFVGVATSIISLANLVLLYKLSLNQVKGYQYLVLFVILEIALMTFFSNTLLQFTVAFVTSSFALLWASVFLLNK